MGKKLYDIKTQVENSGEDFKIYLKEILPEDVFVRLEELSYMTDFYIFSGVIRNFFLKRKSFRDIDIVIQNEIDIYDFFEGYNIIRNSFGGYKITGDGIVIDAWFLKNTWAFKHQLVLNFDVHQYLMPNTAFFNFSAITYSFREARFYPTQKFLQFLQNKTIDLVYQPNANYSLCLINTIYYQDKFKLKVSDRLMRYVLTLYKKKMNSDLDSVQMKHYGDILYSREEIKDRIEHYAKRLSHFPDSFDSNKNETEEEK